MKALRLSLITTFLLCSWVTIAQEDQNPVQTLQRDNILEIHKYQLKSVIYH